MTAALHSTVDLHGVYYCYFYYHHYYYYHNTTTITNSILLTYYHDVMKPSRLTNHVQNDWLCVSHVMHVGTCRGLWFGGKQTCADLKYMLSTRLVHAPTAGS